MEGQLEIKEMHNEHMKQLYGVIRQIKKLYKQKLPEYAKQVVMARKENYLSVNHTETTSQTSYS